MIRLAPRLASLLSLLSLTYLASTVQAETKATPIRDDAGMFHAAAIDRAEQKIASIQQTFDCGLFVRTIASISPQRPRWLPLLRTPRVNRELEEHVRTLAAESGVPGIYIIICNRPRAVHVLIQSEGNSDLNRRDAETLRQTLQEDLHGKGADAALLALVDRVQEMVEDHAAHGSSPAVNSVVLVGLLGGGLVLWFLLRLVRRRIQAGNEEAASRERLALLGTMLGFPAGQWIFDKMYSFSPQINTPFSREP